jgi:uncharacterized protein (DUF952 family)
MSAPGACVYKVLSAEDAALLAETGSYAGSAVDLRDGFVHLSTGEQLGETLARHYRGQGNLRVLAVDPEALPAGALRWEPSRGGALFPHLYAPLPQGAVRGVWRVDVDAEGACELPPPLKAQVPDAR